MGEFVILVDGCKKEAVSEVTPEAAKMLQRLLEELPIKKAAAVVADLTGLRKKALYEHGLTLKNND